MASVFGLERREQIERGCLDGYHSHWSLLARPAAIEEGDRNEHVTSAGCSCMDDEPPNWDFKDRDIAILCELSNDPQLSSRELTDVLEEQYDIDVSHVTVSESIRRMRDEGVFREAIIPNEEYYIFALFEFKFNAENFADGWRDAMNHIKSDKHTLFYFLSDGEYQWKTVMMFRTREQISQWIHEFYKEYGDVIENVRNSAVHNVLKFETDPEIYEDLREETDLE